MNLFNLILENFQKIAVSAIKETKPAGLYYGEVMSTSPLKIKIDQKLILTSKQLLLSTLVQDFEVDMDVDHTTEEDTHNHEITSNCANPQCAVTSSIAQDYTHTHDYKGRKTFKVFLGLHAGEKVILVRVQGGQKYLILDRVR